MSRGVTITFVCKFCGKKHALQMLVRDLEISKDGVLNMKISEYGLGDACDAMAAELQKSPDCITSLVA